MPLVHDGCDYGSLHKGAFRVGALVSRKGEGPVRDFGDDYL